MVCSFAHRAIDGIVAVSNGKSQCAQACDYVLPGTISATPFARFDSTRQLLAPSKFDDHKFPPLIKDFFYTRWHVDYLIGRYYFVISMNISIEHFLVPEIISRLPILIEVRYTIAMRNLACSSNRCEGANVGMHGCKDLPSVVDLPVAVPWSIIPVDFQGIYR